MSCRPVSLGQHGEGRWEGLTLLPSVGGVATTLPPALRTEDISKNRCREVFYISDLHLVHHIWREHPDGPTTDEARAYVESVACGLFDGAFGNQVRSFESPIVFFGGDVSSDFETATWFYRAFVQGWKDIQRAEYERVSAEVDALSAEVTRCEEKVDAWVARHPWAQRAKKPLTEYKSVPEEIKEALAGKKEVSAKMRDVERGFPFGWRDKYRDAPGPRYVYAVLGNHEFWGFGSYEECVSAYSELFSELGIIFLDTKVAKLGRYDAPFRIDSGHPDGPRRVPLRREDDEGEYEKQLLDYRNMVVAGSTGFAAHSGVFSAWQGIYQVAIGPERERELGREWLDAYHFALGIAREHHCPLVVLTHMPPSDWLGDEEPASNVVFFHGHTHRNVSIEDDRDVFLVADNQVGYDGRRFRFRSILLHRSRNPFAGDADGYREISATEYKEFYRYVGEAVPGTGIIEYQARDFGARLFMLKREGYYAFFLSSRNGTYICNGGQIRWVGERSDMGRYYDRLVPMVEAYLEAQCPELADRLAEDGAKALPASSGSPAASARTEHVDIANSPYKLSRRVNALQRLFTKNILRDWDERLL